MTGFNVLWQRDSYARLSTSTESEPFMRTASRSQQGFTLAEVLTTLAVMSLSMSLVIPSLESITRSNQRAAAVNELVATMHLARSEAITRNTQIAVCPSRDGASCADAPWEAGWIRFEDANRNHRLDAGEAVLGAVRPQGGLEIRSERFQRSFAFLPSGRIGAPGSDARTGDFLFCQGQATEAAQVVIVGVTGQPVLASRRVDGSGPRCT